MESFDKGERFGGKFGNLHFKVMGKCRWIEGAERRGWTGRLLGCGKVKGVDLERNR